MATQCTCETAKSGSQDGGGGGGGDSDALTAVVVIIAILQAIHIAATAFAYYQGTKAAPAPTPPLRARNQHPNTRAATANPVFSAGDVVEADAEYEMPVVQAALASRGAIESDEGYDMPDGFQA